MNKEQLTRDLSDAIWHIIRDKYNSNCEGFEWEVSFTTTNGTKVKVSE